MGCRLCGVVLGALEFFPFLFSLSFPGKRTFFAGGTRLLPISAASLCERSFSEARAAESKPARPN